MKIVILNPILIKEMRALSQEKTRGFVRLPLAALQDKRLTMSDAAVLAVILDRVDDSSAELSSAQIAAAAGCCTRTVKSSIARLEEYGYLSVERSEGFRSRFRCPDVLPPKRRWKNAPESKQEGSTSIEEYKSVINKFLY